METRSETSPPASSGPPPLLWSLRCVLFNGPLWENTLKWMKAFGQLEPVSRAHLHPSTVYQVQGTCYRPPPTGRPPPGSVRAHGLLWDLWAGGRRRVSVLLRATWTFNHFVVLWCSSFSGYANEPVMLPLVVLATSLQRWITEEQDQLRARSYCTR